MLERTYWKPCNFRTRQTEPPHGQDDDDRLRNDRSRAGRNGFELNRAIGCDVAQVDLHVMASANLPGLPSHMRGPIAEGNQGTHNSAHS